MCTGQDLTFVHVHFTSYHEFLCDRSTYGHADKTNKPVAIATRMFLRIDLFYLVYGGESHHGVYLDSKHEADNTWSKQNKQASGYRRSKIVWESISSVSLRRQKPPMIWPWSKIWKKHAVDNMKHLLVQMHCSGETTLCRRYSAWNCSWINCWHFLVFNLDLRTIGSKHSHTNIDIFG